jgi:hypothetical protein
MNNTYPKSSPYAGITYAAGFGKLPDSPVVKKERENFYIRIGFCGFNSPANNRFGYASEAKAVAAIRRYQAAGERHRAQQEKARPQYQWSTAL